MSGAQVEHVDAGLSGHIGEYDVFINGDTIRIVEDTHNDPRDISREVEGLAEWIEEAETFRLGWAEMQDGMEIVYLYDKGDEYFGYAVNLDIPHFGAWGYAPFRDQ